MRIHTIKILIILFFGLFLKNPSQALSAPKNSFIPSKGKILLIIGQDKHTIESYISSINKVPAGFMVYTSIQNMEGLDSPVDYGSGIQNAQHFSDKYPNTVIQIGLYMVNALGEILNGNYDHNIDKLGQWIKAAKKPVYLRIGYEFDSPHNNYEPKKYVKAYRYIVDRLIKNKVHNVAYVWHSYANYIDKPLKNWYPGSKYVDWVGISYFYLQTKYMDDVVQFAKKYKKPLMVAEATPCGIGTHYGKNAVERWFVPFFKFIIANNIRTICYINSDWESLPMWKGQGWKDARIQANEIVKKKWLEEINKEIYLHSSPQLYTILGYK